MAGLLRFDAAQLRTLVQTFGVRQTWINLLATLIGRDPRFAYILSEPEFADAQPLDVDLLAGLSIGEIGVLYEYCIAHVDAGSRKDNGQYFTPDDVAAFMVTHAQEFPPGKWLDPCSGIGNLAWHLVAAQNDKEDFLLRRLVLSDRDELALLIARTLFTVHFQESRPRLFHDLAPNFVVFDFLSVADKGNNANPANLVLAGIPDHDFVIVNPPYLSTAADERFETARSGDLYAYFLENIIKTSRGFVSITPQSFTNAGKFSALRALMLRKCGGLTIYTFDNIPGNIFHGVKFGSTNSNTANSMRVAITIAKPGAGPRRITSLMRWRTAERTRMFMNLDCFLSEPSLTSEFFPKVSSVFADLYSQIEPLPRLGDLVVAGPTEYALYVPSAPRYFISALRTPASRASQKTIYFRTEADQLRAYIALNSSLMYWWWRVRDGGMTLALETIKSLPLPAFELDASLVAALQESETVNRVYKMNAGAAQENVKHPMELIAALNAIVCPEFREALLLTHENSELVQLRDLI